ncbi:MAG TPA: alpha/beta hydrolase [Gemmatimonadales bacterium]|nr:alpha/beta hydrolase [Gemmatimonadales bacterium]
MVLCHGCEGSRAWGFFPHLAERLARAGLATVSFDFSGAGEEGRISSAPDRFAPDRYRRELRELEVVLDAVTRGALGIRPPRVGLLGHGTGGSIAILRTAADPGVRALVTWAAAARLGTTLDVLTAAAEVRVPWLIVHGAADESVPPDAAEELYRVARRGTAEKLLLGGAGHSFGAAHPWAGSSTALDQAVSATVAWFSRHLA